MKKLFNAICFIIISITATVAQSPEMFKYQTVVRNSTGEIIKNQDVSFRISIVKNNSDGVTIYSETHSKKTSEFGLVNLEIGNGTIISGSFSSIDWATGPYFVKIELDMANGSNYLIMGASQLLSVPYALHAKTVELYPETDPVYIASVASGISGDDTARWNEKTENLTEKDPVFSVSVASSITTADTSNWNRKLDSYTETDPLWVADSAGYYTKTNLQSPGQSMIHWNNLTVRPTTLDGYGITDAAPLNHEHMPATDSTDGFLSATDKTKLDNLSAQAYVAGDGIQIAGNEISANLSLHASYTGDTLVLQPGNYVFIPGLSNANNHLPLITTDEVTHITAHKAYGHGEITNYGDSALTESGVCWSVNLNPTVNDNTAAAGSLTGNFICIIEGLTENTLYFVRAYAKTASAAFYGDNVIFTTADVIPVPTVSTTEVSGITETTALSGGYVSADGGSAVTARGICWNTSPAPTTANSTTSNGTGTGLYTSYMTGLTLNTSYYLRAYATNANGTNYGPELIFKTAGTLPTVTTAVPQSITASTAILGGEVTAQGSTSVTERGICFGTSANPTTSDTKVTVGTGTGSFSTVDAKLIPNTVYYVRTYAKNSVGTAYGENRTFTTSNAYFESFENGFPGGSTGAWGIITTDKVHGYACLYTNQGGATASITRTLSAAGQVTFYFRTNTSYAWPSIIFSIDDVTQATVTSGSWLQCSFPVSAGTHTFKWIFSTAAHSLGGWLDYIIMPE